MDNPQDVSISSVRFIRCGDSGPQLCVWHEFGFDGYDEFREHSASVRGGLPISLTVSDGFSPFRKRAMSGLATMVGDALSNLERTFAGIDDPFRTSGQAIWAARMVYITGVGVNYTNANNFAYLASTGMNDFCTPRLITPMIWRVMK